ncbi:MAG: sigma-70 family RNA polymerase sigma factor, partial [Myxococcota bacterium]
AHRSQIHGSGIHSITACHEWPKAIATIFDAVGDDRALLAAWHQGDQNAGQRLFARHFDAVCRFFTTKVADGIDDLVQRTFTACLERRDDWPADVEFRPYLFGIARNILRRRYREKEFAARRFDPLEHSAADAAPSLSSIAHARAEADLLGRALQRLPIDLQIAIELRFWEDMTAAQIGTVLEIPEGTAKTRLRRARLLLQEAIEKMASTPALGRSTNESLESWASMVRAALSTS